MNQYAMRTFDAATVDDDAQCYVRVRIEKRHPAGTLRLLL